MTTKKSNDDNENTLTKEQAKEMLEVDDKDMIHTFNNCSIGAAEILVGAYISKKSVLEKIDKSYLCVLTGEQAQATGHGLAVIPNKKCSQSDILFVKTK